MPKVETDLFKLICVLAETSSAKITAQNLKEHHSDSTAEKLVSAKILIPAPHNQDFDVTVDDEDRSYAVQRHNGGMAYFSPKAGWTPVKNDDLLVFQVNFNAMLRVIMDALGIPANAKPQSILSDKIWFLGSAWLNKRKTPVILGRRLADQDAAEALRYYLQDWHTSTPALVLAVSSNLPAYFQLPGQNRLVLMGDAIDRQSQTLTLNTQYLAEKMGASVDQPGFSEGYRTAFVNGVRYEFTPLQAEILEAMDKAGRATHKTEIMAATSSGQENLNNAFRSKGQYHPAWNVIIKNDRKGNYWLEY